MLAGLAQLDHIDAIDTQILVILQIVNRAYVELMLEPFNIADPRVLAD